MKKIISVIMLTSLVFASAFASTVTVQSGSSITLSADTITTVTCEGNRADQVKVVCYCLQDNHSVGTSVINIDGKETQLARFPNASECYQSLAEIPACKRQ